MASEMTKRRAKERMRTRWTAPLDKVSKDLVVEQIQLRNRSNNIFDTKAWGYIRDEFNKLTALNFNNNQLIKNLDVLRARLTSGMETEAPALEVPVSSKSAEVNTSYIVKGGKTNLEYKKKGTSKVDQNVRQQRDQENIS
ncbi:Glutamine and serine-rich protein 1 [Bienertia sinuspersici]